MSDDAPRILYIDDEEDLVNLAESFFMDENIPVDTATSFHQALEMIKKRSYDLIISDAMMPTGTGQELLRLVKSEKLFSGKFILVTGNIENNENQQHREYDMVIYKPLRFQELIHEAKKMLLLKL